MTPEDRDALRELDSRIAAMERRLRNAKTSRDSYMDYLKSKYPHWKSPMESNTSWRRTDSTLINRLLTSEYHWDEERDQRARPQLPQRTIQLYNDIPSGTKLLDSDVARVRRRLTEIAQQLGTIRETRLNLSTEDYLRTKVDLQSAPEDTASSTLLAIRTRLNGINLRPYEPVATPTSEQISFMKLDEKRDQYIADLRAGRVQPLIAAEPTGHLAATSSSLQPLPASGEGLTPQKPVQPSDTYTQDQPAPSEPRIAERRVISFQDAAPPQRQSQSSPPKPPSPPPTIVPPTAQQQSSVYEKMIGIFGKSATSDTEEDGSVEDKTPVVQTKRQVPAPVQPIPSRSTSNTGMLSQYLAGGGSTKNDTTSDSDDDFFK
ncbi:hypothetical protein Q1695_004411 [Nippostrongylus brasiliensis]|nr:hypothetical protein Q1695_004411 [Nippostrongylus brasiliensis]